MSIGPASDLRLAFKVTHLQMEDSQQYRQGRVAPGTDWPETLLRSLPEGRGIGTSLLSSRDSPKGWL